MQGQPTDFVVSKTASSVLPSQHVLNERLMCSCFSLLACSGPPASLESLWGVKRTLQLG